MNAQVHHLPTARREAPVVAPSPTPSLPRTIASALKDSPYREEPWNAVDAYRQIEAGAALPDVRRLEHEHRASLAPVNGAWLKKRLSAMMLAFGHERDPDRVTAWLAETGRLLIDLPGDILATAIDEAIKRSERGFIPAVGQIRAIADPMVEQREREARRLEALAGLVVSGGPRAPRPWEAQDAYQPAEQCSADAARAILEEFGLRSKADPVAARPTGPARKPTEADYIAIMGEAAWRAAQASRAAGDAA